MNIEALKQQLSEGKITKDQFLAELAKLLDSGAITQEEHDTASSDDAGGDDDPEGKQAFTDDQMAAIAKMVQSEADKVRTKAKKEKDDLQAKLDDLETAKMTEEQKAKFELDKLRKQNEDTAAELLKEKVGFHTVKQLSAKELPSEFGEFLAGSTVEDTDERIELFEKAWQKAMKAAVDSKFKEGGTDPQRGKGGGSSGFKNPWSKEHWNMTEQGKILTKDRAEANRLAIAAGRPGKY